MSPTFSAGIVLDPSLTAQASAAAWTPRSQTLHHPFSYSPAGPSGGGLDDGPAALAMRSFAPPPPPILSTPSLPSLSLSASASTSPALLATDDMAWKGDTSLVGGAGMSESGPELFNTADFPVATMSTGARYDQLLEAKLSARPQGTAQAIAPPHAVSPQSALRPRASESLFPISLSPAYSPPMGVESRSGHPYAYYPQSMGAGPSSNDFVPWSTPMSASVAPPTTLGPNSLAAGHHARQPPRSTSSSVVNSPALAPAQYDYSPVPPTMYTRDPPITSTQDAASAGASAMSTRYAFDPNTSTGAAWAYPAPAQVQLPHPRDFTPRAELGFSPALLQQPPHRLSPAPQPYPGSAVPPYPPPSVTYPYSASHPRSLDGVPHPIYPGVHHHQPSHAFSVPPSYAQPLAPWPALNQYPHPAYPTVDVPIHPQASPREFHDRSVSASALASASVPTPAQSHSGSSPGTPQLQAQRRRERKSRASVTAPVIPGSDAVDPPAGGGIKGKRMSFSMPFAAATSASQGYPVFPQRDARGAPIMRPDPSATPSGPSGHDHGDEDERKVVIACYNCRAKKLRCNGARPRCHHCARRGEDQCSYDATLRRRGPGKKNKEKMTLGKRAEVDTEGDGSDHGSALSHAHSASGSRSGSGRGSEPEEWRVRARGEGVAGEGQGAKKRRRGSARREDHARVVMTEQHGEATAGPAEEEQTERDRGERLPFSYDYEYDPGSKGNERGGGNGHPQSMDFGS